MKISQADFSIVWIFTSDVSGQTFNKVEIDWPKSWTTKSGFISLQGTRTNFRANNCGCGTFKLDNLIDIVSKDQLEAIKKKEKEDVEMVLEKAEASAVEENTNNENINSGTIKREDVKVGRNEIISITNGTETKEMKYKKAKPLIDSGEWRIS